MIQINKASVNNVVLTLTEAATLTNPKFLFEFKNDQDGKYKYFIAADTSSYPSRYNKFSITEKANPNALIGEVQMVLTGFWSYRVFEQTSSTNLDPTLCDNTQPLEVGKVLVIGTEPTVVKHSYNPDIVVHNG